MTNSDIKRSCGCIKLLQLRSMDIDEQHSEISSDIALIKQRLALLGGDNIDPNKLDESKRLYLSAQQGRALRDVSLSDIQAKAALECGNHVTVEDIVSSEDLHAVDKKIDEHIACFNSKYALDSWDYAIAGVCGLFAAILDLLCVRAPPKPTAKWNKEVDGICNQWVQKSFNKLIPPELSDALSKSCTIGAPDTSIWSNLIGAPEKIINPQNHRLKSLAHDPLLGFFFGVRDMINGECTVVVNGGIKSYSSTKASPGGSIFQLMGRMFGHLLSDVNAASAKGNRGMGLPAPFMGLLRMCESVPIGNSDFGKQIEWMYVNGYDFRQFAVSSVPMAIMEVMLRVFYAVKQMTVHNVSFGETMIDTMPFRMNPRFRMMLAISYGTSSAVNAGKMYITKNIMNANYASWLGLTWNGFHALKWSLIDRHTKLWGGFEKKELEELIAHVEKIEILEGRAASLPVG